MRIHVHTGCVNLSKLLKTRNLRSRLQGTICNKSSEKINYLSENCLGHLIDSDYLLFSDGIVFSNNLCSLRIARIN